MSVLSSFAGILQAVYISKKCGKPYELLSKIIFIFGVLQKFHMPCTKNCNHLVAFKEGNEEGFDHFFKSWYKQFCFFAIGFIKDKEAAEDIVSDCVIKVWNKRQQFSTEPELKSYFYTTIANACKRWLDNKQRQQKHLSIIKQQTDISQTPHTHKIIYAETIHLLHQAIDTLPDRCRQVFIKMYVEEKTAKEIAAEMNTTISTIKNQKFRGLKLLKPKLTSLTHDAPLSPAGGGSGSP